MIVLFFLGLALWVLGVIAMVRGDLELLKIANRKVAVLVLIIGFIMIVTGAPDTIPVDLAESDWAIADVEPQPEPQTATALERDEEPEPEDDDSEDRLKTTLPIPNHIGVTTEEFHIRWNSIIEDLGHGYIIVELAETHSDIYGFGNSWFRLAAGDWLVLEILLHEEGYVGEVYLNAFPVTDRQGADFAAMAIALVAAASGFDTDAATNVVMKDLGLGNPGDGFHSEIVEYDRFFFRLSGVPGNWSFDMSPIPAFL